MQIRKLFKDYSLKLQSLYSPQEAESLVLWLLDHYLGVKRMDILQEKEVNIPSDLEEAIMELLKGKPIQYIIQAAPFYGRTFKVNPSILIPRNETEELVHLIIQENKARGLKILDLGTGSGCIPITLALEMDRPEITAVDISEAALALAKANAEALGTDSSISFIIGDVLRDPLPERDLDIIVSNPPYVRESEKALMHSNVLNHEPHLALFVPEDDALIFYRKIAEEGLSALKQGGRLYFEINEAFGQQVVDMLSALGYKEASLYKDLNDKDRMVSARR